MIQPTATAKPLWLRILQFPLTRIVVLGAVVFVMMMLNNSFMLKLKPTPLLSIAATIGMGLHMAWNYTLSAIFSGIVSGGVGDPGLIKSSMEGPELLTGGSFGLESSLFALFLCTSAGVILMIIARRRGHILPPPWKR